ncbi:MAG TPA: DUF3291 domain-containing protein [Myxococcota bacterium]|nr:DUF3291 domain-containing protein [Myxococcota bacterium]
MSEPRWQIAQANVARMRAPLEDALMEGFRSQLERINALADASPGFVWRLQTESGDATGVRAFEDPLILFNMSVWETLEALHRYVYRSEHVRSLRARRSWFVPLEGPSLVLWWIPAGQRPAVAEGRARLERLRERGLTPEAFTFRAPFPAPGAPPAPFPEVDAEFCGGAP